MKKIISLMLIVSMVIGMFTLSTSAAALDLSAGAGAGWTWIEETKMLTLNNANINEAIGLPDGATVIVNGDCTVGAGSANAITCEGSLTVKGTGKLALAGVYGISATSVSIENVSVDFNASSCGINVYNAAGAAKVALKNVNGTISGGYAGIYVNGECTETEASVVVEGCDLVATSTATSWNSRARKAGITVYVSNAKKVESSITIKDSKVNAAGYDAGLSINNYLNDADATNYASSRINITNSTVVANSIGGTWAGIFASVLGQHPDADSIITITNSSVYATSVNTGILTSSQKGESKIILNNSILGAAGKTALSMIEPTSQAQVAELNNGSTYVQMTPAAVMKGEIANFSGKTVIATAGSGITYDAEKNYFVIPQGSAVTESYTSGTVNEYTFNNQAGGIGGFNYAKEKVWGYDVPEVEEVKDATAIIRGTVTLDDAPASGFDFVLVENGKEIDSATSENGSFRFSGIKLDSTGRSVYQVKQVVPADRGNIVYDRSVFTVVVNVTLNNEGTAYKATVTVQGADSIAFENETKHVHTAETVEGKAPTCTETGLTEGSKCTSCGETLVAQEEIPALGHIEEAVAGKAPTCTETGLTDGAICTRCGETLVAQEEIDALGHIEEAVAGKAPTCTEAGLTDGVICTRCGETLVAQEEIDALGHVPGEPVKENEVAPTETSYGSYDIVVYCIRCGAELSRETFLIDMLVPETTEPEEEITEEPTPLDPTPETTEPEETTEAEEEITDPEIPLDPNPETGDSSFIIVIIAIASIALAALYIKRRQVIED